VLRVIRYGFLGIILGTTVQLCRFFFEPGGPDFLLEFRPHDPGELLTRLGDLLGQFRTDGLLGLLVGLAAGLVIGVFVINLGSPRKIFPYGRTIRYELASCRVCDGTGWAYGQLDDR
jgi:hypothetical protein